MHSRGAMVRAGALALALAAMLVLALPAAADGPAAAGWLKGQQNADGGFGAPESGVGATADVLLAAAAAGERPLEWTSGGASAYDYLEANAGAIAGVGNVGKVILALVSCGANPRALGDADLVAQLEGLLGSDGQYGDSGMINDQALALIALASAQRTVPGEAVDHLLSRQIADGTWAWNGDKTPGAGDNNTAALAAVALIAAGVSPSSEAIQATLAHFHTQQNEDGGFPYISPSAYGTDSDSNSTAVVIWTILSAGQDPAGSDWKYEGRDGASALDALRALQNESGAFRWQDALPDDNFMSTVQAAIAVELKTLPFATMEVGEAQESAAEPLLPVTGGAAGATAIAFLIGGALAIGSGALLRARRSGR